MSKQNITAMTCDRCGEQSEIRRVEEGYNWARLNYSEANSHRWIGTQRSKVPEWADLCPACSKRLYDWFQDPRIVNP